MQNVMVTLNKGETMLNAIILLRMEAKALRSMTTPNTQTITEYAAKKNMELAEEYEFAAEALRKLHNEGFKKGYLLDYVH